MFENYIFTIIQCTMYTLCNIVIFFINYLYKSFDDKHVHDRMSTIVEI